MYLVPNLVLYHTTSAETSCYEYTNRKQYLITCVTCVFVLRIGEFRMYWWCLTFRLQTVANDSYPESTQYRLGYSCPLHISIEVSFSFTEHLQYWSGLFQGMRTLLLCNWKRLLSVDTLQIFLFSINTKEMKDNFLSFIMWLSWIILISFRISLS